MQVDPTPEQMADMDEVAEFANSDAYKRWLMENPHPDSVQEGR
jgi:hypothetical protein